MSDISINRDTSGVFFAETQTLSCVATYCSTCLSLSPWFGAIILHQRTVACFNSWHMATTVISNYQCLVVQPTRLSIVDEWVFPVAATRVWNSLPVSVTSATLTLNIFKQRLKTELFIRCYGLVMYANSLYNSVYSAIQLVFFFLVKCPSSLWTSYHYNNLIRLV